MPTPQVASPQVSLILPTYNEAHNIVPLIQELKRHLNGVSHEILLMDDNSPDRTAQVAEAAFADDSTVQVHIRVRDRGLAKAVREGVERSRGAYVLVMDSDFNHDPAIVGRLVELSQHADMVIGSRFCDGGGMASRWRYHCSRLYSNWFVRPLLGMGVRDNLCGYYLIRRDRLMRLPYDEIFHGYGDYFFRLLWHARAVGCSMIETPVFYRQRPSGRSKSNLPVLLFSYTWTVLDLWLHAGQPRWPAPGSDKPDTPHG
ncbi:MAG: glycosyltransferase [Candidatus Omnitrophica bacterium]|nr:glycosyltransferase [Candidatus Omnitrophota bacterium]MBI3021880.1 glycosyltransferase [Candidatus Omnitrophota bacterium]MBI3082944.1 glycosyltransferase [Candidatus Omnitrophota bacterium]